MEAGSPGEGTDPTECPICLESFAVEGDHIPMSLHCGHSVCAECVPGIRSDAGWQCPICRFVSRADELRPNYSLIEQLDALFKFSPKQGPQCEECEGQAATVYCEACQASLCNECMNAAHRTKVQKRHTIRPINERPETSDIGMCAMHRQPLRFMCLECMQIRCGDCVNYGDCKGHNHDLVLNIAAGYRERLASGIGSVQENDKCAQEAAALAERMVQEIGSDYAGHKQSEPLRGNAHSARNKIRAEFEMLRSWLDSREEQLMGEVDAEQASRLAALEEYNHEIGLYRSQVSTAVYRATTACSATDTELCAQYDDCLNLLEEYRQPKQWETPVCSELPVEFNNIFGILSEHGSVWRSSSVRFRDSRISCWKQSPPATIKEFLERFKHDVSSIEYNKLPSDEINKYRADVTIGAPSAIKMRIDATVADLKGYVDPCCHTNPVKEPSRARMVVTTNHGTSSRDAAELARVLQCMVSRSNLQNWTMTASANEESNIELLFEGPPPDWTVRDETTSLENKSDSELGRIFGYVFVQHLAQSLKSVDLSLGMATDWEEIATAVFHENMPLWDILRSGMSGSLSAEICRPFLEHMVDTTEVSDLMMILMNRDNDFEALQFLQVLCSLMLGLKGFQWSFTLDDLEDLSKVLETMLESKNLAHQVQEHQQRLKKALEALASILKDTYGRLEDDQRDFITNGQKALSENAEITIEDAERDKAYYRYQMHRWTSRLEQIARLRGSRLEQIARLRQHRLRKYMEEVGENDFSLENSAFIWCTACYDKDLDILRKTRRVIKVVADVYYALRNHEPSTGSQRPSTEPYYRPYATLLSSLLRPLQHLHEMPAHDFQDCFQMTHEQFEEWHAMCLRVLCGIEGCEIWMNEKCVSGHFVLTTSLFECFKALSPPSHMTRMDAEEVLSGSEEIVREVLKQLKVDSPQDLADSTIQWFAQLIKACKWLMRHHDDESSSSEEMGGGGMFDDDY